MFYDKYQTRRTRDKWCKLVSHIPDETLSTKTLPRRVTIYLEAPPGDGLRAAREHFHEYIKPVLVAAAMDWDVVEGRKEGDVRWKTAENARRKRRRGGEGVPLPDEEYSVELVREKAGTVESEGVAGDLVVGRHTWKEYVRGLHEGWLGPVEGPTVEGEEKVVVPAKASEGDAAAELTKEIATAASGDQQQSPVSSLSETLSSAPELATAELVPEAEEDAAAKAKKEAEEKKDEPPKPRHPPAYITPEAYPSATISALTPETIGPATPISFPHLLGFRNTPIRIYRFLNRRRIADDVGRQVAAAVLASHRPFSTASSGPAEDAGDVQSVLAHEERDWWKTTYRAREAHEESVWIEDCVVDERLTGRMRLFELTSDEEERAKRIGAGKEGARKGWSEEDE
jgi:mitochondrial import inner membrane translocase subunit TIM54